MKRVFYDLETGGLNKDKDAIIQIAAMCPETGEEFERKVKFRVDLASPEALQVNSYNKEDWEKEAIPPMKAAKEFSLFLRRHSDVTRTSKRTGRSFKVAQTVAYNGSSFDAPFLQSWYKRLGAGFLPADYKVLDPLQLAMWLFPTLEDHKLETVAKHLGVHQENAHDAMVDVRMMVDVTNEMEKLIRRDNNV